MTNEFCLKMPDFHVTFRDILHAVNLRHGKTALPPFRRKACSGFFPLWKIRRLRPGLNPRTRVPKASTLPLEHRSCKLLFNNDIFALEVMGVQRKPICWLYMMSREVSKKNTFYTVIKPKWLSTTTRGCEIWGSRSGVVEDSQSPAERQ